jgi:hypothetical protein
VGVDQSEQAPTALLPDLWTVKEVIADLKSDLVSHLDKQDVSLVEIVSRLDGKADKADVVNLGAELHAHVQTDERRLSILEDHKINVEASARFRKHTWTIVGSIITILAILGGSLIAVLVH